MSWLLCVITPFCRLQLSLRRPKLLARYQPHTRFNHTISPYFNTIIYHTSPHRNKPSGIPYHIEIQYNQVEYYTISYHIAIQYCNTIIVSLCNTIHTIPNIHTIPHHTPYTIHYTPYTTPYTTIHHNTPRLCHYL
jgi:hypothetical protein